MCSISAAFSALSKDRATMTTAPTGTRTKTLGIGGTGARTPLTPASTARLAGAGLDVCFTSGLGMGISAPDHAFIDAGATIAEPADLAAGDIVVTDGPLDMPTIGNLPEGTIVVGLVDPFWTPDAVKTMAARGFSVLSLEFLPRTSIAQPMDALSSQASLAGYQAVIRAADRLGRVMPMMSTAAGVLKPARVLVIGAGVAGLQAIATAKRLGARVDAYDTRPVVAEQVRSLGARFLDLSVDTDEGSGGYAKELTDEQLAHQRRQLARACAQADIVITTAQVFGRPAPRIIDADTLAGMKPGSVVVDMAASTGGNVEGSVAGREIDQNGVLVIGHSALTDLVAVDASEMLAANIANLIEHAWDKDAATLALNTDDSLIDGALIITGGAIRNERLASAMAQPA